MRFRNTGASLRQQRLFEPDDQRPHGSDKQNDNVHDDGETSVVLDLMNKKQLQ